MTVMVGLNTVIAALLAFTGALSIGASLGMRGNRPMSLFGITLLLGSLQTIIMSLTQGPAQMLAAILLAPMAFTVVAYAITTMPSPVRPDAGLVPFVAVMMLVSVGLVAAGAPFRWQVIALELSTSLPGIVAVREMIRRARPTLLDGAIVTGIAVVSACNLARLPLMLFYYGPDITQELYRVALPEVVLLALSGLTVPALIFLLIARNVADALAAYQQQSERDALTGLLNRRGVDAQSAAPSSQGGAVIFCDIDHFKSVNDLFGHQAGDDVIRSFARILSGPGYPVGRMGGEEFSVVLEGHTLADALDLAEMFRARCASANHDGLPPDTTVTASFGVARYNAGVDPQSAFAAADQALYRAKRDGRDRVVSESAAIEPDLPIPRQVA
jgi:diguanylate cyclase (GGDEF)-like protein